MADLIFYCQYIASKAGKTGLTVTVDIFRLTRSSGAASQVVTGGSAVEVGDGLYRYLLSSADPATYDYAACFKTSDATVDQQYIPALWTSFALAYATELGRLDDTVTSRLAASGYTTPPSAASIADAVLDEAGAGHAGLIPANLDAKVSAAASHTDPLASLVPGMYAQGTAGAALGRVGIGRISVRAPVAETGEVETYQGTAYLAADNLALEWTDASGDWPDLTGATVTVYVDKQAFTAAVEDEGTTHQKVMLELAMADSAKISRGRHEYTVVAARPGAEPDAPEALPPLGADWWTSKVYLV